MSNEKLYTHNGITKNIAQWAKHAGVKPVTLARRLQNNVPFEIAITTDSLKKRSGKHYKTAVSGDQKQKREHVVVVEKALGKQIPKGAVVHHIDGDINNNSNNNLLLCPSHSYHAIIHARQEARDTCGNPEYRKCVFCHKYDDPKNMQPHSIRALAHRSCYNAHMRSYREQRRAQDQS